MLLKCHARDSVGSWTRPPSITPQTSGNERAYFDTYRIGCTSGVKALWGHGAFKIVFKFQMAEAI